jgi:glycosyltransferase involved in cell wall biosynthesis
MEQWIMKIIYIENVRVPSERAHAYQIVRQCAWMGRLGHDVMLVNPDRAGGRDVFSYFNLPDRPFSHVLLPTLDFLERAPRFLKPIAYAIQRFTFVRSLRAWAGRQKADAWYTRDPAIVNALRTRVKDPWFLELHDAPDNNRARWNRVKDSVRGFVVITHGLKRYLIELGVPEERITVAPDGYEPKEFESMKARREAREEFGIPQHAFVLFYGGSFYPWKGLDPIVRSWAQTDPRAHLVLMGGPDPDTKRLNKLVPPDAMERVHILPRRSHRDLVSLYPAADVGLIASSSDHKVATHYTSPLKLFEYLAAGLPVLASGVPTSREVLDERVAKFFGPAKADFHRAFSEIMQNPAWLKSAAEAAPEFVKRYTWQERAIGIVDFMRGTRK